MLLHILYQGVIIMSKLKCYCESDCTALSVIASIAVGIIVAILTVTATIAIGTTFLWAAAGVALFFLAAALVGASHATCTASSCFCSGLSALFAGVFGTVLAALILLLFDLAATGIVAALISGALAGFVTLVLTSVACLIKCISGCDN